MANEAFGDKGDDPQHLKPYIDELMRETHRLDPSRFRHLHVGKAIHGDVPALCDRIRTDLRWPHGHNRPAVWRDVLTIEHSRFRRPCRRRPFTTVKAATWTRWATCRIWPPSLPTPPRVRTRRIGATGRRCSRENFAHYDLGQYFKDPSELCRLIGLSRAADSAARWKPCVSPMPRAASPSMAGNRIPPRGRRRLHRSLGRRLDLGTGGHAARPQFPARNAGQG